MVILAISSVGLAGSAAFAQPAIDPLGSGTSVLGSTPRPLQPTPLGSQPDQVDHAATDPSPQSLLPQVLVLAALTGLAIGVIVSRKLWRMPGDRLQDAAAAQGPRPAPHLFLLGGLGLWFALQVGGAIAVESFATRLPDGTFDMSLRTTALGMSGMYLTGALVLGLFLWRVPGLLRAIGLHFHIRDLFVGVGWLLLALPILFLISILMMLVATWVQDTPPDAAAHSTLRMLNESIGSSGIFVMALVILGAPFFEEIVYRGFIQTSVRSACGPGSRSAWCAIILTSIIFAGIHIGAVEWYAMPTLVALAIVLGVAYERSGRLAVPIIIHALFNAVQLIISLVQSHAPQSISDAFATLSAL